MERRIDKPVEVEGETDRMSVEMNSEMDRLQDLDGWRDG